ncbi:MAG: hypothetical protein COA84_13905 [Robiginitomaculum sp.]|nr:MAG: hypothetical protein COA84_13905 [Robiginitomaculum sp.]
MLLVDYIETLEDVQLTQIIRDQEILDERGHIGDCVLRETIEDYLEVAGIEGTPLSFWMSPISTQAYRVYALRYIDEHGKL